MLAKSIIQRNRVTAVCERSGDIRPGEIFQGIIMAQRDDRLASLPVRARIVCCGKVSDEELLFRTEDGRCYFSVLDGWGSRNVSQNGSENRALYALRIGLFHQFGRPTTAETLPAACEEALRLYRNRIGSWITAMIYDARKRTLEKILSVMKTAQE